MLFSIVEGSGSMARCSMLVQAHSGEITPTIMEAPARVQLGMVKDPGVKLLRRWVRDEMVVPSLPQLWEVVGEIHQVPALSRLMVETGGKGVTHWKFQKAATVLVWGEPLSLVQESEPREVWSSRART